MRQWLGLMVVSTILAGCVSGTPATDAKGPQFAPDDPCKGVVPQMCAY